MSKSVQNVVFYQQCTKVNLTQQTYMYLY